MWFGLQVKPASSVEEAGVFFIRKQMGLLYPPEQPIAGYCAAGRNNPLLYFYRHDSKKRLTIRAELPTAFFYPSFFVRDMFYKSTFSIYFNPLAIV